MLCCNYTCGAALSSTFASPPSPAGGDRMDTVAIEAGWSNIWRWFGFKVSAAE